MSDVLYTDMGPPYVVQASIAASATFVPTMTTSTVLIVRKPSGAEVTWETTTIDKTTDRLLVHHALAAGELDEEGYWTVRAESEVEGGSLRTEVEGFFVLAPWNRLR